MTRPLSVAIACIATVAATAGAGLIYACWALGAAFTNIIDIVSRSLN